MRVVQGEESSVSMDDLPKRDRANTAGDEPETDPSEPSADLTYPPESPPGYYPDILPPRSVDGEDQEPLLEGSHLQDNPRPYRSNWTSFSPRRIRLVTLIGLPLFLVLFIGAFFMRTSRSSCPSDADIIEARRNWAIEKEQYSQETRQWEEQRKKWQRERKDEERRRKDIEMRRKGVYWTEPEASAQCTAYSTKRYTAVLRDVPQSLNWLEVCSDMPVVIHTRTIDRPDKCERNDNGTVLGTWFVSFNEPTCVPYWDGISDKGCAPGGLGMRRLQGRLWGIRSGDDWEKMCSTTPATFKDASFEHPTSCQNKGSLGGGVVGLWDYPDETC